MLPELILKEERTDDYPVLLLLGLLASVGGFFAARTLFPNQSNVLSVVFASLPLIYPLTAKFLEDEKEEPSYIEEISLYGALFTGQVFGFTALSLVYPESLSLQSQVAGLSGHAVAHGLFLEILFNNLLVFTGILAVSAIFGSAGAFILVWNASVMGKFFAELVMELQGLNKAAPLFYFPHAALEMTGFILAGITGSLISAAAYRKHFKKQIWTRYILLAALGLSAVLAGAGLETGFITASLTGLTGILSIGYVLLDQERKARE
ncbi:MAG: stage II sporulation protein M [Candidatus Nanohalobium sp.]